MAQVDPLDMLNNFCFHLYAQKSLFIAENCNAFFFDIITIISSSTLSTDIRIHRAGSQLKTWRFWSFFSANFGRQILGNGLSDLQTIFTDLEHRLLKFYVNQTNRFREIDVGSWLNKRTKNTHVFYPPPL